MLLINVFSSHKITSHKKIYKIIKNKNKKFINANKNGFDSLFRIPIAIFYCLMCICEMKFKKMKKNIAETHFYSIISSNIMINDEKYLAKAYYPIFKKICDAKKYFISEEKTIIFLESLILYLLNSYNYKKINYKKISLIENNFSNEIEKLSIKLELLAKLNKNMKLFFPNKTNNLTIFLNRLLEK
ncbi:MAG: hypothetical protein LBD05_00385 [Mycoplasmataceae bacterium]|jgi:hypothetical protein|nr:hypothetical protein [Mycoplasmataceae bacterium]